MLKRMAVLLAVMICLAPPLNALCENSGPPEDGQTQTGSGTNLEGALDWLKNLLFGQKRKTPENMTHQETVAALRSLGIEIPDETVRETEKAVADMVSYWKTAESDRGEQYGDFVLLLLSRLGEGEYDYDTGIWTPTSSQVYAFDAEVYDIEHMYALFLQGVSSIVPGFECTDVTEHITVWSEEEAAPSAACPRKGRPTSPSP